MRSGDLAEFTRVMAGLQEYYQREVSDAVVAMYWRGLAQYDVAAVKAAAEKHIRAGEGGTWFPKVSELAKIIDGSAADQGALAWSKVREAIERVGQYDSVVFDDALIHAVVEDLGGWVKLCRTEAEELPFVARNFETRYRAAAQRAEPPAFPARLMGVCEVSNRANGVKVAAPVLVGDPGKAALVLERGNGRSTLAITVAAAAAPALAGPSP